MLSNKSHHKKIIQKTKKQTKKIIKPKKSKTHIPFHFYDDQKGWFAGITFDKNNKKIKHMMCTENIKCNLVFDPHQLEKTTLNKQKNLLNKYISRISNYNMRNIIQFRYNFSNVNYIFNPDAGLNDEQINFLSNPNLDKCMVGFDMDGTLHQCGWFINTKTKELIKDFSRITRSKISYNDIGEYYFGGKIRLNKIKTMFQNLERTIGSNNIYIITANSSTLIPIILPDLYGKLFGIKLHKKNIKQIITNSSDTKYDIIKKILGI